MERKQLSQAPGRRPIYHNLISLVQQFLVVCITCTLGHLYEDVHYSIIDSGEKLAVGGEDSRKMEKKIYHHLQVGIISWRGRTMYQERHITNQC